MSYLRLDEDVLLKVFKNSSLLNEIQIKAELEEAQLESLGLKNTDKENFTWKHNYWL